MHALRRSNCGCRAAESSCLILPLPALLRRQAGTRQKAPLQRQAQRQRVPAPAAPRARMHVPSDTFGGRSPERRAAEALVTLFTAVALRVVLAQLGGGGEGGDLPPTPQYTYLRDYLAQHPLTSDGDAWLAELLAQDEGQMLGLRILEVRQAYCTAEFDWAECQRLAAQQMQEANVSLLRTHAARKFGGSLAAAAEQQQRQAGEGQG